MKNGIFIIFLIFPIILATNELCDICKFSLSLAQQIIDSDFGIFNKLCLIHSFKYRQIDLYIKMPAFKRNLY